MKAPSCPLLALSLMVAAGCSSGGGKSTPGGGGNMGAAGAAAGTTGAGAGGSAPDAAAGTGGGRSPDAAAGSSGGGAADAGFDVPLGPGITIIQEDQPGFAAVDGKVYPRQGSTNVIGYTGTGFADGDPGVGKTIAWSVKAEAAGTFKLIWRYAFGGQATNLRDAKLVINGVSRRGQRHVRVHDRLERLAGDAGAGGAARRRLELHPARRRWVRAASRTSTTSMILGDGISPDNPSFSLTVASNEPAAGTVSCAPMQAFYPAGASVTLTATANAGSFFQSWTGDSPSATATTTITMTKNMVMTARFLPNGTVQDPALVGYAAVQDDVGTPYLLNGGSLGPTVTATTFEELKTYLGSPNPYVVTLAGLIEGADSIDITSNKTLLGVGSGAHLQGIELQVSGARNVIIRNVAVSHVVAAGAGTANDAIVLSGAMNVWIDRCDLYSDLTHGKDYYDGLLEIKNGASFVTVSRCHIHDHYKVSLISSGDEQVGDTVIRATYHHNYFHDVGSRLPSIRFGKAHVFNNYYANVPDGSGVNSRMGAVVRVEGNHFQGVENPIVFLDSARTGTWDVTGGNTFVNCTGSQPTTSTGQLTPPYPYTLDPVADVPTAVPAAAGVGKL